jgi:hypothetical protein
MTDSDKPAFVQAFNRLALSLREKDPDAMTLRTYFDGVRDLEIEFVTAAADSLARRAEYGFPKVPDWRREAQRIESERDAAQRAGIRRLREPLCSDCGDTRVRYLEAGAAPCPCRHQRRLELLGRVPRPELPPHAPTVNDRPLTHGESMTLRASIPPMKPPIKPARAFARHTSDAGAGAVAIAKELVEQIARVEEAEHAAAEHERPADTTERKTTS